MPAVRFRNLYRRTILALSAVAVLSLPSGALFYYRLSQEKVASQKLTELRRIIDSGSESSMQAKQKRDRMLLQRDKRSKRDLILTIASLALTALLLWLIYQSAANMKLIFDEAEKLKSVQEAALQAERRLSQAQSEIIQEEKRLSKAKSTVIETISHECRTPLTAIMMAVELMESRELTPDRRKKYLGQIRQGVRRLSGLVDDVLILFQMEATATAPAKVPIDLRRWFSELAESTGQEDRIRLSIQVTSLLCDEILLHRIFSNLLNNALKYSKDIVLIRARPVENGIEILVKDRGIGIPRSTRLFQPFERGSNVGLIGGTGLGLSIVKKAIELSGGTIAVDSQEEKGTEIRVALPS